MFSSRFHWDFQPNRLTRALEAKRREGAEISEGLENGKPAYSRTKRGTESAGNLSGQRRMKAVRHLQGYLVNADHSRR